MIIDATSPVAPRRYKDRELRQMMGDIIGKSSADDLLACFLWAQEGRIAKRGLHYVEGLRHAIDEGLANLMTERHRREALERVPFACDDYLELIAATAVELKEVRWKVSELESRAMGHFSELHQRFGDDSLIAQWDRGNGYISPLEAIGVVWDEAVLLRGKAVKLLEELDVARERVRKLSDKRKSFYEDEKQQKYTLSQVDSFDHKNFEILVSWLTRRDGMKARRTGGSGDLGADVVAVSPDGRRFVFQCKHTRGRRSVDSAAVQRLNGTAWQVHKADIAVMVTSGGYSKPASEFARSQNIHLIDRESIRKWSEWGDSLYAVLGIDEPAPQSGEEAA